MEFEMKKLHPIEIEAIFEDDEIEQDLPYSAFLGLQILRKYCPEADIGAASHDLVCSTVSVDDACEAGITKDDIIQLRRMNWMIEEDCFAKFV